MHQHGPYSLASGWLLGRARNLGRAVEVAPLLICIESLHVADVNSDSCRSAEQCHFNCRQFNHRRSADDPAVVDLLESHIARPDAGGESDAVFAWLYAWARSPAAPLQRFVARFAPSLAAQYLLRSAANVSSPGLEVCPRPWSDSCAELKLLSNRLFSHFPDPALELAVVSSTARRRSMPQPHLDMRGASVSDMSCMRDGARPRCCAKRSAACRLTAGVHRGLLRGPGVCRHRPFQCCSAL